MLSSLVKTAKNLLGACVLHTGPSCYTCHVIACPECGWFAEISRRAVEDVVWAEHLRDGFCADAIPVRGPARRRTMCIKGHAVDDPFGICWECARLKAEAHGQRARMHPRSRPFARRLTG